MGVETANSSKVIFQRIVLIVGIFFSLLSLFGPNPLLCVPSFISLYIIISLLWYSKFVSAFMIAFIYQWFQVSIKVLYATVSFTNVVMLTDFPDNFIFAYFLSTLALMVLTYGISFSVKKMTINEDKLFAALQNYNFYKISIFYFLFATIISILTYIPGIYQVYVILYKFKWALFYLLFLISHVTKQKKTIVYLIVGYEFVIGFFSYFAGWKTIVFFFLIAWLSTVTLKSKQLLILMISFVFIIYISILWTGVKGEYRTYVSQGNHQVVLVTKEEAFDKLKSLIKDFNLAESTNIQKAFLDRISYIDYFSACLSRVPSVLPHENGQLTLDVIKHCIQPRIFFRNKPILDDSSQLNKYTGLSYAGYAQGTSFSLGYVTDLYIDYGIIFMFVFLFLLGYCIGKCFLSLFVHAKTEAWTVCLMILAFSMLYKFEISMLKLIHSLILFWIVYRLVEFYILPKVDNYFNTKSR
jgi:hypothetical protein